MPNSPEFDVSEAGGVQLPVLATLSNLGWRYLTRTEVEAERGGRRSGVILEQIALEALARINGFEQDGVRHAFTASAVSEGLAKLTSLRFDGLLKTNEAATDLLLYGTTVRQEIGGLTRERTFRYVDFTTPTANDFHMTAEMSVEGRGPIRVDVVLFVNGIPLAAIELKKSAAKLDQGISQMLRNQNTEYGAPQLFQTTQILIAGSPAEPRYGTVGTKAKYWSLWREPRYGAIPESEIERAVNGRPDPAELAKIHVNFSAHAGRHRDLQEEGARLVTDLDRTVVGLLRPDRLLDLSRRFTLFDAGVKKIARYQQVSAVTKILDRVQRRDEVGRRLGGVIWHTQGSGKSLTMVMLARALFWAVADARILIVTDRKDLDRQISGTFRATRLEPVQARTGMHLAELIRARAAVITTVINKFRAVCRARGAIDRDENVFILVDESHRSQYGDNDSLHEDMRRVFPRACYLGFTGTPLTAKDRNTFVTFGELIDRYTIDQAVKDKAVLPLFYEGRAVREEFDEAALDTWFERASRDLTDAQRAKLKKRMTAPGVLQAVPGRLKAIAWDIREHFRTNFKGDGLKGQVVAPSKAAAVRLKRLFDVFNDADEDEAVTAEVVISAPDKREGHEDIDTGPREEVAAFWAEATRGRSPEEYERDVIERFDSPNAPDLLIVVSKLLTGFDVQRNAVLYLVRELREHNLLQAIARVNRVYDADNAPPKERGLIVDYSGVLEDLSQALVSYDALKDFDAQDLEGALIGLRQEANRLPELHRELLSQFDDISNRFDQEAYARALADEDRREHFKRALSEFASAFNAALSLRDFVETTPADRIRRYKADIARFEALRREAALRYGESLDWSRYHVRIRKLLEDEIRAHDVAVVVPTHDILLGEAHAEVERTPASLADEIATRLNRTITERMDADPAFYKAFSLMVREAYDRFHRHRGDERDYLTRIRELEDAEARRRRGDADAPAILSGDPDAVAIHGVVAAELSGHGLSPDHAPQIALDLLATLQPHLRVGWQDSRQACNDVLNAFDDYFYDDAIQRLALPSDGALIDAINAQVLAVARERLGR